MFPLTEKYVNPLTDFGFKKIFGEEPNKDILISFQRVATGTAPDSGFELHQKRAVGLTTARPQGHF